MARDADQVPPLPRRSNAPRGLGPPPRPRAPRDRGGRDGRRALRRPQPPGRAGRAAARVRRGAPALAAARPAAGRAIMSARDSAPSRGWEERRTGPVELLWDLVF